MQARSVRTMPPQAAGTVTAYTSSHFLHDLGHLQIGVLGFGLLQLLLHEDVVRRQGAGTRRGGGGEANLSSTTGNPAVRTDAKKARWVTTMDLLWCGNAPRALRYAGS